MTHRMERTLTLFLIVLAVMLFNGCEKQDVLSPAGSQPEMEFIELGTPVQMANLFTEPVADTVKWARANRSTRITLLHSESGLSFEAEMVVKKNSLNNDGNLTLSLDDALYFSGTFEPTTDGGLALSKKSNLTVTISGADLTGLMVEYIKPYYHNLDTGEWEEMPCQSIAVDSINGTISVVNARMPDFGRYALYNPDNFNPGVLTGVTEWITYDDGAELIIDYKGSEHGGGPEEVKTTFKILPQTISEETWVTLSMSESLVDGDCNTTFGPHGLTFSEPALLNIEAKNIDLSGVNPDSLRLYYMPYDSEEWEEIEVYDIIVKQDEGYVKIIDAQLHHFSRYALSHL